MTIILVLLLFTAGAFGFRSWSKQKTLRKLRVTALSDHQRAIVAEQVPLTQKLPSELLGKLEGTIAQNWELPLANANSGRCCNSSMASAWSVNCQVGAAMTE